MHRDLLDSSPSALRFPIRSNVYDFKINTKEEEKGHLGQVVAHVRSFVPSIVRVPDA